MVGGGFVGPLPSVELDSVCEHAITNPRTIDNKIAKMAWRIWVNPIAYMARANLGLVTKWSHLLSVILYRIVFLASNHLSDGIG